MVRNPTRYKKKEKKEMRKESAGKGKGKSAKGQRGLARGSTQSIPLLFIQLVVIINVYIQYECCAA